MPLIKQIAEKQPGVQDVRVVGERLRLRVEPARIDEVSKRLVGEISAQGGALREVRPVQGSLEDVYIALTEMAVS
jgi:hypothetical protein